MRKLLSKCQERICNDNKEDKESGNGPEIEMIIMLIEIEKENDYWKTSH